MMKMKNHRKFVNFARIRYITAYKTLSPLLYPRLFLSLVPSEHCKRELGCLEKQ